MLCMSHVDVVYLIRSYQIMLELSGEVFNPETLHSKGLLLQKGTTLNNIERHRIRQYKSDHKAVYNNHMISTNAAIVDSD